MKVQIDCYGFEATSEHFQKRKLEAHLVKNDGGIVYACFGTEAKLPYTASTRTPTGASASCGHTADGTRRKISPTCRSTKL